MRVITVPGTNLAVSRICLGTGILGAGIDRAESFALLDAFAAAGGTFLDTAHVYSDWLPGERHRSEQLIGSWLKSSGRGASMVVATKGAHPDLNDMTTPRLAPADIARDLDESLACLDVEQIDLYLLHRDDPARPVGEILETLEAQRQAGKIGAYGCSNWQTARILEASAYAAAHALPAFAASQLCWSLAVPNAGAFAADLALMDNESLTAYRTAGLAVMAYSAQAGGFFSKAEVTGMDELSPALRRSYENEATLGRLQRVRTLAAVLGTSVSAVVLAYITSQPMASIPVIGPRTLEQLGDSLALPDLLLTADMLAYLADGAPLPGVTRRARGPGGSGR
jgi:aryl-alcohol dehydrogenase-like predicted oxidoreductase